MVENREIALMRARRQEAKHETMEGRIPCRSLFCLNLSNTILAWQMAIMTRELRDRDPSDGPNA